MPESDLQNTIPPWKLSNENHKPLRQQASETTATANQGEDFFDNLPKFTIGAVILIAIFVGILVVGRLLGTFRGLMTSPVIISQAKKSYKVGEPIDVIVSNNGNQVYAALEGQSYCSWISIEAKTASGFRVANYCSKSYTSSTLNVPILPISPQGRPIVPKTRNLNSGQTKYTFTFTNGTASSQPLPPGIYRFKIYTWSYDSLIDKESLKSFTSDAFEID